MTGLDETVAQWVVQVLEPGSVVVEVRGLRAGASPWLVRLQGGHLPRQVVVRVGRAQDRALFETECTALELAAAHGIAAPRLLAAELAGDPPRLLIDYIAGSTAIPSETPVSRLRTLGALAASLTAVRLAERPALPRRDRPIAVVDFGALRARHSSALLREADKRVSERRESDLPGPSNLVHGDLWQGNAVWDGDRLTALIDWDCAGIGPAGIDLGSLRCDAALCFGLDAAEHVLDGWAEAAGRPAEHVAHWDLVAALCTPPDIGWFAESIAAQGRPDLSRELLRRRRDEFLEAALARSGSP